MKIVELTAIAARIFAIYLFLYGLRQAASLAGYLGSASYDEYRMSFMLYCSMVAIPLVIAAIIWRFPITISKVFLPNIQSEEVRISDGNTFLPAALIVLGIYVLTYAIPDLFLHFTRFYMVWKIKSPGLGFGVDSIAYFVATVFELIIGFWLILGQAGLLRLIAKVRGRISDEAGA